MIKFKKLVIENFCSFKYQEIDLTRTGVFLVLGENKDEVHADSNGAGKSLILEAFCWALWGETIRNMSSDEVVNKSVKKNTKVCIEFSLDDNTYIVTRYHKHKIHIKENDLILDINGVDNTSKSIKDTQALINQAIGLDFESFCYLTPGAKVKISQLTDKGFKELLESFTKLHLFDKAHEKTKALIKEKEFIANRINLNINTCNIKIAQLNDTIPQLLERSSSFECDKNAKLAKLQASMQDAIKDVPNEAVINTMFEAHSLGLTEAENEHFKLVDKLYNMQTAFDTKRSNLDHLLTKYKRKRDTAEHDLSNYTSIGHRDSCHVCKQSIDSVNHAKFLKEFEAIYKKAQKAVDTINETRQTEIDAFELLREQAYAVVSSTKNSIKEFNNTLAKLHLDKQTILNSKKLVASINESISLVESQENTANLELANINKRIREENNILEELTKELTKEQTELDALKFWLDAFSAKGLRSFILKKVTPFINKRLDYYCKFLSEGSMQVSISTEKLLKNGNTKDEFSIATMFKNGSQTYSGCSEGEKGRVDLVLSLAMADLVASWIGVQVPLRFFDEAFEKVDASGLSNIVKLLHENMKSHDTVYIITHNTELKQYFDNRIIVSKHNGESKIHDTTN